MKWIWRQFSQFGKKFIRIERIDHYVNQQLMSIVNFLDIERLRKNNFLSFINLLFKIFSILFSNEFTWDKNLLKNLKLFFYRKKTIKVFSMIISQDYHDCASILSKSNFCRKTTISSFYEKNYGKLGKFFWSEFL